MSQSPSIPKPDLLTVISISALAYITSTGLHEHLGHTTACYLLGSRPTEIGAIYVTCNYVPPLSDMNIRLVALAGPLVSLLVGMVCFLVLHYRAPRSSQGFYFIWLLGSIGLMTATGFLFIFGCQWLR